MPAFLLTRNSFSKKQYIYVAQILLVVSIALSKLSIGLLFKSLMNRGITQWANWGLIGAIMAWAIGSIAALAARCSSPHPWSVVGGKCDHQVSESSVTTSESSEILTEIHQDIMFEAIGALNIITDLALVLLSCAVLWTVQVSLGKRMRIISLLAIRLV